MLAQAKKLVRRVGARSLLIALLLIATGSLLLGTLDGWLGAVLWAVAVPILCVVLDLAAQHTPKRRGGATKGGPKLILRRGPKGRPTKSKPAPPPRFVWREEGRPRRRSR